jgi:hypothetical protein
MSLKSSWTRVKYAFAFAVVVGTASAATNFVGCGTSHPATVTTYQPYLYTAYYPADVAYSTMYWTDDWAYATLYAAYGPYPSPSPGTTGTGPSTKTGSAGTSGVMMTGTAGTSGTTGTAGTGVATTGAAGAGGTSATGGLLTTAGDAVRALARGESVCPGQINVTPKTAPPACTGAGKTASRAGVTIVFSNCQTPGGPMLNGTIDVTSSRIASQAACGTNTTITLSHTTTITNLSYTNAAGARLVIPSQTGTGMTTYRFGQTPPTVALTFTGQLQTFPAGATAASSDHNYTSSLTYTFGGAMTGYTVDGGVTAIDNLATGSGATLTVTGLKRVTTCCRPVGGSVSIVQSGPTGPGNHVVGFGPSCGQATVDGAAATLPACI